MSWTAFHVETTAPEVVAARIRELEAQLESANQQIHEAGAMLFTVRVALSDLWRWSDSPKRKRPNLQGIVEATTPDDLLRYRIGAAEWPSAA